MNTDHLTPTQIAQWQRMLAIVKHDTRLLQPDLANQFKKLYFRRLLTENIIVFLLQYTGIMISVLQSSFSFLWLASGTACAFIFMRGYSILPGIWLGSFFAYYFAISGIGLAGSIATILTVQAAFLLKMSFRYISPTLIFYRKKIFVKFVLVCGSLTAITSFMLSILCFFAIQDNTSLLHLWLRWWLADLNGILILSCALMTWDTYFTQINEIKQQSILTLCLSYGLLLIITATYLFHPDPRSIFWFALTTLPLILFIGLRLGWCGTISAVFLLGMIFMFAAFAGILTPSIYLQLLLTIETISGLLIAINCRHC